MKKLVLSSLVIYLVCAGNATASDVIDTNHNGEITEQEFLTFKLLAFNTIDKNFDSKLTQDEIALSQLEKYQDTMRQAFRELDINKDGRLTEENLLEQYNSFNPDELTQSQDDTFDLMDKNGNNNISRLEYNEFLQSQTQKSINLMKQYAEQAFDDFDFNKDGYVDENEYVYQGRDPNAESLDNQNPFSDSNSFTAAQEKQVLRDGNGDGIISKSEDTEHSKFTFSTLDTNNDGIVTKSESPYLFSESDFIADGFLDLMYLGSEVQRSPRE